jgi:hypothetical protein
MAGNGNGSVQRSASRSTLVVTNLTKVAGLVLGTRQGFEAHPDARVIALAAFMLAGAQVSENVMIALIERFLGAPSSKGK